MAAGISSGDRPLVTDKTWCFYLSFVRGYGVAGVPPTHTPTLYRVVWLGRLLNLVPDGEGEVAKGAVRWCR